MPTINKSYFAIIGLLSIKPMTAYELVKFSKESIGLFWNESYGHIHKSLKELEKKEAVMLMEDHLSGRKRKVYDVTVLGRKMLKEWLCEKPDEIVLRNELMLKVFVSDRNHNLELLNYIQAEEQSCREIIKMLQGIEESIQSNTHKTNQSELWLLTLNYGHRYLTMTIEWCQHAQAILNKTKIESGK